MMNTLTFSAGDAPAANVLVWPLIRSGLTRMLGASGARSRKLRLLDGRVSICFWLTLVATSEVLVSGTGAAWTTTSSSCTVVAVNPKSSVRV